MGFLGALGFFGAAGFLGAGGFLGFFGAAGFLGAGALFFSDFFALGISNVTTSPYKNDLFASQSH